MIGIPVALLTANAAGWAFHKYVQHGFGSKKGSFWDFHWREHHKIVRQGDYSDPGYQRPLGFWVNPFDANTKDRLWNAQTKEVLALTGAAVAVTPFIPVAPFFTGTLYYCAFNYYRVHRKSHLDPAWAKKNVPWHYDHHMAKNQHANWCVTKPWFDQIMGTREPWLGTEEEKLHLEKQVQRKTFKKAA